MFYVGGNFGNSNVELHDVRFSIGDVVLTWGAFVAEPEPAWVCRPAVVLLIEEPDSPTSPLTVSVFRGDRLELRSGVPFSAVAKEGCWSWRSEL